MNNPSDMKNKVEAILFTVGARIHTDKIAEILKTDVIHVKEAITLINDEYNSRNSPVTLIQDGDFCKLGLKTDYTRLVENMVVRAELDKPLMETLAVIAWKYPILQADVIKIRHNKAYDHLKQLDELGFVARQKHGRTNKLILTQKFFDYFDLPDEKHARETMKEIIPKEIVEDIEKAELDIEQAEKKIEEKIEESKKRQQEFKSVKQEQESKYAEEQSQMQEEEQTRAIGISSENNDNARESQDIENKNQENTQ